ncbi:unnamed protein product [Timema podura]|nr:unnamed protein product [Timema podura]
MVDDLILELIYKSSHLLNLKYDGVLRNINTLREICHLQLNDTTNFQSLYVRPKNLNDTNRSAIEDIQRDFSSKLAEKTIIFKIE